jgi:hypothetical protein
VDVAQLVSTALAAGAEAARGPAAAGLASAVGSLCELLTRQFGQDPVAAAAMERLQTDGISPQEAEAWQVHLRARLRELSESVLNEVQSRSEAVLMVTDPQGVVTGRYAVTAVGGSPPATGDIDVELRTAGGDLVSLHTRRFSPRTFGPFDQPIARSRLSAHEPVAPTAARQNPQDKAAAELDGVSGGDTPDPMAARASHVLAHQSGGHRKEIIAVQRRILDERELSLGVDHPDTIDARIHLAYSYRSAGNDAEAIELLERVLAGREGRLGSNHPDTLAIRTVLLNWRGASGSAR